MARRTGLRIDLLLTDVVMPVMSGRILAQRFRELQPDARILFMSGYTDDAIVRHGVLTASMPYLQKPFTTLSLAAKVREVLDARPV
jgi:YesN/AraC family two-component response regulator